jgi:hypothetical protein
MHQNNYSLVTRAELIQTFSDIDEKINDLHIRSSADFLQLNNYLKDYYNKTNIVSGNAFRILETIAGKKDINLIEELETIHQRLDECRVKIREDDFNIMQVLRILTVKSNQLNIALRNIKQDLTTFKFLLTNYNLISNCGESDINWKNGLEKCDIEIQSIHASLATIGTQVDRFKEQIVYNIDHLELKVEKSLKIFHNLSKDTKVNIERVLQKSQESKLHFPVLKEKTTNSSRSINNIITHLQYHDIIRQKIEHIQTSHSTIVSDLNETISKKNDKMANIPEEYQKIGDIAGLQAAQLLMVSKEYQNALDIITKNFQDIANDLTTISNISTEFSYNDSNSEITLLKQIRNQLDEGIILLDLNHFRGMNIEYLSARKKLDRIAASFKNEIDEPLNLISQFDVLEQTNPEGRENKPSVLNQIFSLAKEIKSKNTDICLKINEMQLLSANLYTIDNMDDWGSQLEQDRIKLMVTITRILDALDKDNEELDNVLIQNRDLNNYILEKIENAINKVDYYDYFENIVEQVISRLNSINQRFRHDQNNESAEIKAENLKDIKTSYTMESERIVHNNVVSGQDGSENAPVQKTEDDIEFF